MAVITPSPRYWTQCDHPKHDGPRAQQINATSLQDAIIQARRVGWYVGITNIWANCPTCRNKHGLAQGYTSARHGRAVKQCP